jgi:hypothetical protein
VFAGLRNLDLAMFLRGDSALTRGELEDAAARLGIPARELSEEESGELCVVVSSEQARKKGLTR